MRKRRRTLAFVLALIGLVGIAGWILGNTPLRQWVPSSPPISASSCLAFLIAAGTFFFLEGTNTVRRRLVSFASGASIFILSSLALIDRVFSSKFAAEYLLFPGDPTLVGVDARGRLSLANGVALLLVSTALLLAGRRVRGGFQPSEWLFFGSGSIGLIAALGYAFNDPSLSGFPGFHQVSLPGSVGMLVLSVTGLLAWPETGLMATLTGRGPAAILARRLLFPASALLILTAFGRSVAERRGLFGPEFGSAAFVILNLILLATLVAVTTDWLERAAADRARAEDGLRRSEERFRSLVENSYEVTGLLDREGHWLYASPSTNRIWGYSKEELLATQSFGERIHPENLAGVQEVLRRLVATPEGRLTTEFRARHKDGSWRVVEAATANRLEDPSVRAIVVNLHDITDRKAAERALQESEERFRTLIESAPVAIGLTRDGRTIYANPKLGELYGYPSVEELRGRPIVEQWAPECRAEIEERMRQPALGLPASTEYEALGQRRDGSQFPVLALVTGVELADGPATICFLLDITDRKQAEKRLKRSYVELRALAARMETVREEEASRIAHELHDEIGQAMTAVKIHLETLQQRDEASAISEELGKSVEIAARALSQVRDLSLALRPSVLDDLGLAAALRWLLDRQAQLSGFAGEFSSDLPPERLARELETACFRVGQQALTNITQHAGARRVSIELRRVKTDLWLSVRDDGVGFDVAAARVSASSGRSLGILGMEERVSLLGGSFEVHSESSGGTVVRARFPLADTPAPAVGS